MKKIKGINRKASKNKRYRRQIGYKEFISSIEARKALVKSMNLMDDTKGEVTMCEKVQRLIDESNEELRIKYAKELEKKDRALEIKAKALEKEKDINLAQATEISRLKAQIAAMQGS